MNKKILAALMSAVMSVGAVPVVLADTNVDNTPAAVQAVKNSDSDYIQFDITVKTASNEAITADVEGKEVVFTINENTIYNSKTKDMPTEGDRVIIVAHEDAKTETGYIAKAIVKTEGSVFVGEFEEEDGRIISDDEELVITLEDTGYTAADIEDKEILVVYSFATMSIPPMTNPEAIIILEEDDDKYDDDKKEDKENKENHKGNRKEYTTPYVIYDVVINDIDETGIVTELNGSPATFAITEDTIQNSKTKDIPTVGESVKVIVDGNAPMTLQEPPVYTAVAVIRTEENVYAGEFDEEDGWLVSEDNAFAFNTEGTDYNAEELEDNDLIVIYGASTRSIPAQITPSQVIVLKDNNAEFKEHLKGEADRKKKENKKNIDMYVNRVKIDFAQYDNVEPFIEDDYTLVPLRAVAEALGCEVSYDDTTKTVTITNGDVEITLVLNASSAKVNGEEKKLDKEAKVKNGRTVVPARFVSESLGNKVDWDGESLSVIVR